MDASLYPLIDFASLAEAKGVSLVDAFVQLQALYSEVDARNAKNTAQLDLPCHRGCDMCCHESVFLTPLEFYYMWSWAQTHLSDAVRQGMIARALALYTQFEGAIMALDVPPADGAKDHFAIAQKIRFTCPMLSDEGACQVYPVRELLARLFGCSFNDQSGIYGCHLVAAHLADKTVTLMPARPTARRLGDLPLTDKRQVYPYYFHHFFGPQKP